MWHMPGHIYSDLHRYADAAWQQEASARTDHAYMMRDGVLPGIPQLKELEDGFPLEMVRSESQETDVVNGLINSIGLDGHCCSLILTRCTD